MANSSLAVESVPRAAAMLTEWSLGVAFDVLYVVEPVVIVGLVVTAVAVVVKGVIMVAVVNGVVMVAVVKGLVMVVTVLLGEVVNRK